nr:hypothetical protein Iba_chr15aCG13190 [Ipomoea batatas]
MRTESGGGNLQEHQDHQHESHVKSAPFCCLHHSPSVQYLLKEQFAEIKLDTLVNFVEKHIHGPLDIGMMFGRHPIRTCNLVQQCEGCSEVYSLKIVSFGNPTSSFSPTSQLGISVAVDAGCCYSRPKNPLQNRGEQEHQYIGRTGLAAVGRQQRARTVADHRRKRDAVRMTDHRWRLGSASGPRPVSNGGSRRRAFRWHGGVAGVTERRKEKRTVKLPQVA